jgi:Tfp pilus assembly protein PilE
MGMRLHDLRRLRSDEEGLTLIEVLVAAIILALAALAVFGVLVAATRNAQRAQAGQVAQDKAQEEIEKLHSLSYEQLALTEPPPYNSSPLNPNSRVQNNEFDLKRGAVTENALMVVNKGSLWGGGEVKGGIVAPGPIPFQEGTVSGKLFRYVVWRNDPTCPESEVGSEDFCPGGQDYKQIVVVAKLDKGGNESSERAYVEVQSQVVNPDGIAQLSTQGDDPGGGGGDPGEEDPEEDQTGGLGTGKAITAQQFFLSDTPCAASGTTVRQEIAGDHLLHNTLGTCASGPQTGSSTPGAPDALVAGAPPDPDPADEGNPGLYDYSSDSYLEPTPDTDKGIQILHDDTAGCAVIPKSGVHPEAKTHRWVTDPMPRDFKMSGTVTIELYSRTLNELSYPGTLCVYLFDRDEAGGQDNWLKHSLTGNPYWTLASQGTESWPRTEWTKMRLTMNFAPLTVLTGHRLGVALSVDAGTTPADAIPVMYDHPNYPTRIEVDTTTPLEGS